MTDDDTILVRAGEGRVVIFHSSDAPAGSLPGLRLEPGDEPIEVPNTTGNRRMILDRDLVLVDRKVVTVDHDVNPEMAARVDALLADTITAPVAKISK